MVAIHMITFVLLLHESLTGWTQLVKVTLWKLTVYFFSHLLTKLVLMLFSQTYFTMHLFTIFTKNTIYFSIIFHFFSTISAVQIELILYLLWGFLYLGLWLTITSERVWTEHAENFNLEGELQNFQIWVLFITINAWLLSALTTLYNLSFSQVTYATYGT